MFAPLQSATGRQVLQHLAPKAGSSDTLVYHRKGVFLVRSTAALHVARDLGGSWPLAYGLIILPRPLRDALYNLVARKRYRWFGRRDQCMVPSPALRHRFLD
mgnify:FL=1